jgi:hypothetical protein
MAATCRTPGSAATVRLNPAGTGPGPGAWMSTLAPVCRHAAAAWLAVTEPRIISPNAAMVRLTTSVSAGSSAPIRARAARARARKPTAPGRLAVSRSSPRTGTG